MIASMYKVLSIASSSVYSFPTIEVGDKDYNGDSKVDYKDSLELLNFYNQFYFNRYDVIDASIALGQGFSHIDLNEIPDFETFIPLENTDYFVTQSSSGYENDPSLDVDDYKAAKFFSYPDGFKAVVYEKLDENDNVVDVLVSFAGTEFLEGEDLVVDITSFGMSQWYEGNSYNNDIPNAKVVMDFIENQYMGDPNFAGNVNFTGHSLGGALAQFAAYDFVERFGDGSFSGVGVNNNIEAFDRMTLTTFNALGGSYGIDHRDEYGFQPVSDSITGLFNYVDENRAEENVKHFTVDGDAISLFIDHLGQNKVYSLEYDGDFRNQYLSDDTLPYMIFAHKLDPLISFIDIETYENGDNYLLNNPAHYENLDYLGIEFLYEMDAFLEDKDPDHVSKSLNISDLSKLFEKGFMEFIQHLSVKGVTNLTAQGAYYVIDSMVSFSSSIAESLFGSEPEEGVQRGIDFYVENNFLSNIADKLSQLDVSIYPSADAFYKELLDLVTDQNNLLGLQLQIMNDIQQYHIDNNSTNLLYQHVMELRGVKDEQYSYKALTDVVLQEVLNKVDILDTVAEIEFARNAFKGDVEIDISSVEWTQLYEGVDTESPGFFEVNQLFEIDNGNEFSISAQNSDILVDDYVSGYTLNEQGEYEYYEIQKSEVHLDVSASGDSSNIVVGFWCDGSLDIYNLNGDNTNIVEGGDFVNLSFGSGNDYAEVHSESIDVDLGDGNNTAVITTSRGESSLSSGSGDDYLVIDLDGKAGDSYLGDVDFIINSGSGSDIVELLSGFEEDDSVTRRVTIDTGDGNDHIKLDLSSGIEVDVFSGSGDDVVEITGRDNSLGEVVEVFTGDGNDQVVFSGIGGDGVNQTYIDTGSGLDTVLIQGWGDVSVVASDGDQIGVFRSSGVTDIVCEVGVSNLDVVSYSDFNLRMDSSVLSQDVTFFRYSEGELFDPSGLSGSDELDVGVLSQSVYILFNQTADDFYQSMVQANGLENYDASVDGAIYLNDSMFDAIDDGFLKIDNIYNITQIEFGDVTIYTEELVGERSVRDSGVVYENDAGVSGFTYVSDIHGTFGDDILYGDAYKNRLHASDGLDYLYGGASSDVYMITEGLVGETVIVDSVGSSLVSFGDGIYLDDLSYSFDENDLVISVSENYSVRVQDWVLSYQNGEDKFRFYAKEDGDFIDANAIKSEVDPSILEIDFEDGSFTVDNLNEYDRLSISSEINPSEVHFFKSAGNLVIEIDGSNGFQEVVVNNWFEQPENQINLVFEADGSLMDIEAINQEAFESVTYHISDSGGSVVISEIFDYEFLMLDQSINEGATTFSKVGSDLEININSSGQVVTLLGWYNYAWDENNAPSIILEFESSGESYSSQDLSWLGVAQYGTGFQDEFFSTSENEMFIGGDGGDIYNLNPSWGVNRILDNGNFSDIDEVEFFSNNHENLWFEREGDHLLVIDITTGDEVIIDDFYNGSQIEIFIAGDYEISSQQAELLAQSLSSFGFAAEDVSGLDQSTLDSIHNQMNAYWYDINQ